MQLPSKSRPFRFALVASCAALLITAMPILAQQGTDTGVPTAVVSAGVRASSGPDSADHVARRGTAMQSVVGSTPTAAPPAADAGVPVYASTLPEPRLADDWAPAVPLPPPNHTIVISTLALVLIAVLIAMLRLVQKVALPRDGRGGDDNDPWDFLGPIPG